MKIKQLLKEIKGVFKPPKRKWYFGPLKHGTPYFWPMGFNSTILSVRRLKLKTKEELERYDKNYPHLKNRRGPEFKFSNMPIVRRSKCWIKKIFGVYFYIKLGWPVKIGHTELGWKDKYKSPRFEWSPSFHIYFFKWQLVCWWLPPTKDGDKYWEMILWWLYYSNKDVKKAEKTWGWVDSETKQSTWNHNNLIKTNAL